jgi:hypothetical protein
VVVLVMIPLRMDLARALSSANEADGLPAATVNSLPYSLTTIHSPFTTHLS